MEELKDTLEGYAGVVSISEENPTLKVEEGYFELPYSQTEDSVMNAEFHARFIKKCETMIRSHEDYKHYIGYLKNEVGLTYCQVMSNIDDEMADIEMHHGPVLNLFDICGIVLRDQLLRFGHANTFTIVDQVLEDHYENIIQVIMLSTTIHQILHAKGKFINMKHAFGDIGKFLDKYEYVLEDYQKEIIYKYIETSLATDTQFIDVLQLGDGLSNWSKMNYLY